MCCIILQREWQNKCCRSDHTATIYVYVRQIYDNDCIQSQVGVYSNIIDGYYNEIINCVTNACRICIPKKTYGFSSQDFVVAGWNDFVKDKHEAARKAFLDWKWAGRPRQGLVFEQMKRSRSLFKLALRYCKDHEDQLRADSLAASLSEHDYKKFWNTVRKTNNNRASKFAVVVDGCTGEDAIAERWRSHFETVYNSIDVVESKSAFNQRMNTLLSDSSQPCLILVHDIIAHCAKQKVGKAVGPDSIAMEALIYGTVKLHATCVCSLICLSNLGICPMHLCSPL